MSSLRRGHANLLCIVPILVYVLLKRALIFFLWWELLKSTQKLVNIQYSIVSYCHHAIHDIPRTYSSYNWKFAFPDHLHPLLSLPLDSLPSRCHHQNLSPSHLAVAPLSTSIQATLPTSQPCLLRFNVLMAIIILPKRLIMSRHSYVIRCFKIRHNG